MKSRVCTFRAYSGRFSYEEPMRTTLTVLGLSRDVLFIHS